MTSSDTSKATLKWWQLSLFGVGSIIGTGFFLGSSIGIKVSGPAVLLALILAALGTYIVFDALAKMTAKDPQKGAFRTYAKKAYGRWAGFSVGWVYWSSEMLIMGSQLTALSIFTRFWFPEVPLWVFASAYAVLGLVVLILGVKGLNRLESLFAVIKTAAIIMFIFIAFFALFGFFKDTGKMHMPQTVGDIFPHGPTGLWSALIYAFYAFGGIEVMGLMAIQLKDKKEAPKSGKIMLFSLLIIYLVSIGLAILLVPLTAFKGDESPFIIALNDYELPMISHVFNSALVIAGFSTMVAALYGVTSILVSLAEDKDAPSMFAKKGKLAFPLPALLLTASGLVSSILTALFLPDSIYEYITTGAGLMLLYNWFFIILSGKRLLPAKKMVRLKYNLGMILIILAVSGTVYNKSSRIGFFISLSFLLVIAIVAFAMHFIWKRDKDDSRVGSLFVKKRFN